MSSDNSSQPASSAVSSKSIASADPITRNALRYTVSAKEYELLHKYLLSRAPLLKKRTPQPEPADEHSDTVDDYNASTVRVSFRLFLSTYAALKAWELVLSKLTKGASDLGKKKVAFFKTPSFRLSLSLSSILLFHRLLFRFFTRLRESLRTSEDAKAFRRRNPRVWKALTSRFAPPVGASFSGLFLGLAAAEQIRITIAIYFFSRAAEFTYRMWENRGYFKALPWWFGSWLLMPMATGQLLHAFVFDRDCFPGSWNNFIMQRSPEYVQQRPLDYPTDLPWPTVNDIVDSLANISQRKWPAFVSPILFPKRKTLPSSLSKIAPITDPAHPAIQHMSCAVLHPNDPSCLRTWLKYYIRAFPQMAKFFTIIYTLFSIPRIKGIIAAPMFSANLFARSVLRSSFFLTSAIGTAWSSICLFQNILPGKALPTSRWFLSGFIAGMWAFIERGTGHGTFMDATRTSMESLWKVGKKRGWWKGITNGDVLVFASSLLMINYIYERDAKSVNSGVLRKSLGVMRGEGWVDRTVQPPKEAEKAVTEQEKPAIKAE